MFMILGSKYLQTQGLWKPRDIYLQAGENLGELFPSQEIEGDTSHEKKNLLLFIILVD